MNILMMTNTYTPVVGGLERSVQLFKAKYQERGHRVLIVAPAFKGMPPRERDVIRVPAIQRFNRSDFSVKLPLPSRITQALLDFAPDVIHAHHPFLMGATALRFARTHGIPLVFTHHTLFEQYTHYTPVDSPVMQRFVIELSTGFANLCDCVFAPSESVARLLASRGVVAPIEVVPTGIEAARFRSGDGAALLAELGVPKRSWVIGHVGRLAPEKNPVLMAHGVAAHLQQNPKAHFLVVGRGPSVGEIRAIAGAYGVAHRLHFAGVLQGQRLVDAYHAMDVFVFASKSETQGLVVAEAMAAGVPVVALDAPGVREVVRDRVNGRLLAAESPEAFAEALRWVAARPPREAGGLRRAARKTAQRFTPERCAARALRLYRVAASKRSGEARRDTLWVNSMRRIKTEWHLLKSVTKATGAALGRTRRRRCRRPLPFASR